MPFFMKSLNYRGPGEHSVRELEAMLAEAKERISNLNSLTDADIMRQARKTRISGYTETQESYQMGFLAGSKFIIQSEY